MVGSAAVAPIPENRSFDDDQSYHGETIGNELEERATVNLLVDTPLHTDDNGKTRVSTPTKWLPRFVSLYWPEKLLLVIQYGQLFALLWAFAREWPLPAFFRDASRWTTWANIDLPSVYSWQIDDTLPELRRSEYGEYENYWIIAAGWAAMPVVLGFGYIAILWYGWLRYWDVRKVKIWGKDLIVGLAVVAQLPAALALCRLYVCQKLANMDDQYRLAVDPEMVCLSTSHLIVAICCLPSTLFVLVGIPIWMIMHIRGILVFDRKHEHERYLRWKEAEYIHDLSFDWRRDQYWLMSSFKRNGLHPYERPIWMLSMSLLVLVYSYARYDPAVMVDFFFAVVVLWSLRQGLLPAYRCNSTNFMALLLYAGLSVIAFWGLMRAHGLTNSMTVDSVWSKSVMYMNIALAASMLACLVISLYPGFGWPTGYIGPNLWKKLMQEELDAVEEALPASGGTITPAQHTHQRPSALRGAISSQDIRHHNVQRLASKTETFLLRAIKMDSGRVPNSARSTKVHLNPEHDLEAQQAQLISSEQPNIEAHKRPSIVADGMDVSNLDELLQAREREYEIRQLYGDKAADEIMLQEHAKSFRWEDQSKDPGSAREQGARKRPRKADEQGPVKASQVGMDDEWENDSVGAAPPELKQLTAAEVSALEAIWISLIKGARRALKANEHLPPEIVNVPELRRRAKQLKREFRRAHRCRHVLAWTLEETIDDLAARADACESITLFPNAVLEELLYYLKLRVDQRDRDFALTHTKRKNVGLKMFALACLVGGRKIARLWIKGVNDEYFRDIMQAPVTSHMPDDISMYSHIQSIYRDVTDVEISMMGLSDLREVVQDVIPERLRVDIENSLHVQDVDVDSERQLLAFRAAELHEDTIAMLIAASMRASEMLTSRDYAGGDDDASHAEVAQLSQRVDTWVFGLLPRMALDLGIGKFPLDYDVQVRDDVPDRTVRTAVAKRNESDESLDDHEEIRTLVSRSAMGTNRPLSLSKNLWDNALQRDGVGAPSIQQPGARATLKHDLANQVHRLAPVDEDKAGSSLYLSKSFREMMHDNASKYD